MSNIKPLFFIAEAGVNHNGDVAMAKELVAVAAKAGADAVKFQTYKAELLTTVSAQKAKYQIENDDHLSQFDMLKNLELSEDEHHQIAECCQSHGIEFMSTAFDEVSLNFLIDLGMHRIKIPSGEITNHPFLECIAKYNLPMIMSTGMSSLVEVEEAVNVLADVRRSMRFSQSLQDVLTILHCTSNYPTVDSDVNLLAMRTMGEHFNLAVGYSDHTPGKLTSALARAMGATVIEKHFTIDTSLPGPDHKASLSPQELIDMINLLKRTDLILGDGIKSIRENEVEVSSVARRSIVVNRDIAEGHTLLAGDLTCLRPGTGLSPKFYNQVLGMSISKPLAKGELLAWDDLL